MRCVEGGWKIESGPQGRHRDRWFNYESFKYRSFLKPSSQGNDIGKGKKEKRKTLAWPNI